ncbi:acetolactate synthase large subunit [Parapedomonas caeni]
MNGADLVLSTLKASGVDVCFANPGTSEMHFVSALDRVEGIRPVLGLFEGVVTGAADGYGRMADKPAVTLLHLGPGFANGMANLHNGRRAGSPVVNIVGDHATYHRHLDAPLTSDIEGMAATVSKWVRVASRPEALATDVADAVTASLDGPRGNATLILPADIAWNDAQGQVTAALPPQTRTASEAAVRAAAEALRGASKPVLYVGGRGLRRRGLEAAARVAAVTGARVVMPTFAGRLERGAGLVEAERLIYFGEMAQAQLIGTDLMVLVGVKPPVSFFAYPGKPSELDPEGVGRVTLATEGEDETEALEQLADLLGAPRLAALERDPRKTLMRPEAPTGALTIQTLGQAIAATLPEGAIVSDESATGGAALYPLTAGCPPHDWLFLTGGSIGQGLPVAAGAAVACPDRKVVCVHGDGGAMYTLQALWTMAREKLDVVTVIIANRAYAILNVEMVRTGAPPGPKAAPLFDLTNPTLEWTALARGMGVEAFRATTAEELVAALRTAMATRGPVLIEAVIA